MTGAADLNAIRDRLEACGIVWQADVRVYDPATGCCPVCHRETLEARITGGRLIVRCTAERAISRICNPALTTLLGIGPSGPAALNGNGTHAPSHDQPLADDPLEPFIAIRPAEDFAVEMPTFPTALLPRVLRDLVEAAAASLPAPAGFIAVPALIAAGACIGNRTSLVISASYEQPAILWGGIVGPPASKKTPSIKQGMTGISRLQSESVTTWRAERDTWKKEFRDWERRKPHERGEEPEEPHLQHYWTTDATIDALAPILERSPGLAIFRDELVGWVSSFGQYSGAKGADRAKMLEAWSGGQIKVDRKGDRGVPIIVDRPHVCVVGGVQPDKLSSLADEAGAQDGFLDHFLWSWPMPVKNRWTRIGIPLEVTQHVTNVFRSLRTGALPPRVFVTDRADAIFGEWYERNAELAEAAVGLRAGIYAKLDSQALRLALVLHCLEHADDLNANALARETMIDALHLTEYFRAHGCRVADHLATAAPNPRSLPGRILAALIEIDGFANTTRLWRAVSHGVSADELHTALEKLCRLGLVQGERPEGEPGRRGRLGWRWRAVTATGAHTEGEAEVGDAVSLSTRDCIDIDALVARVEATERGEF